MFKRRDALRWLPWMGRLVYPKGGWGRAASYVVHRLRRLPDPPHKIARGVAAGVFACFTPFFGFHFFIAAGLAFVMQGNILAALLSTFFGNPITFPIIAAISLELGYWMLGVENGVPIHRVGGEFSRASVELWHNATAMFTAEVAHWDSLHHFFWRICWPYFVGGIIPGIITAVAMYMLARPAVSAYQKRRIKKLKERFDKRKADLEETREKADKLRESQ